MTCISTAKFMSLTSVSKLWEGGREGGEEILHEASAYATLCSRPAKITNNRQQTKHTNKQTKQNKTTKQTNKTKQTKQNKTKQNKNDPCQCLINCAGYSLIPKPHQCVHV